MSQSDKLKLCRETVQEMYEWGVPASRIIPLMDQSYTFLRMGEGLVWSQIMEVITDVCGFVFPEDE